MKKILLILFTLFSLTAFSQTEVINVGTTANDGTGDKLRNAMIKINTNFSAVRDSFGNIYTEAQSVELVNDSLDQLRLDAIPIGDVLGDAWHEEDLIFRRYEADHYVATWGDDGNAGTFEDPWKSWYKAITSAARGDTIYVRGGEYGIWGTRTAASTIAYAYQENGTPTEPICIFNYPGEVPVIDCDTASRSVGNGFFLQECKNWRLRGLTIKNVLQPAAPDAVPAYGFKFADCDSIYVENCVATAVQGEGFWCSTYGATSLIGYYNFLNCDSYNNYDPNSTIPGNNSNGFDFFNMSYTSVLDVRDCRAWDNGDDGFDTYWSDALVNFYGCWAFSNGHGGIANGFKLGLEHNDCSTYGLRRYVVNCIAATNGVAGFTSNVSTTLTMELYNNSTYLNGYHIVGWWANAVKTYKNNLGYANTVNNGTLNFAGETTWNSDDLTGVTINASDFISLDTLELIRPRQIETYTDGSEKWVLPEINFMKLVETSDLIETGIDVGLSYYGNRPDMGAVESTKTLQSIKEFYTATVGGAGTGVIHPMTQNITVTSSNADYICCLPEASAATVGTIITGTVGANGFELRVAASQAASVYLNNVTTNVEAAIPANTNFKVTQIDATHWILECTTNLGAVLTAIIPN